MRTLLLAVLLFLGVFANAQSDVTLDYYLPQNVTYNPDIPTPKEVIGHEIGEWHVSHDKLVFYLRTLAKASNRIMIEERGTSFENRPLPLVIISSPNNLNNLESIRKEHLSLTEAAGISKNLSNMPIVVYQAHTIHGNEPSGANAAIVYAYYLAAAQGAAIEKQLNEMVVLLDACLNPDGFQRFSNWVNVHKHKNLNPDPNDREYREVWPGGRTNHYWFDMNRDWLPVQMPESTARIKSFLPMDAQYFNRPS